MEVIDIKEILKYFKTKILYIVVILLIVVWGGILYTFVLQTPKYQSVSTVLLKNDTSQNNYYNYTDASLNRNLLGTYSEIVKSKRVLNEVIKNLNLPFTYAQLHEMVKVSHVQDTELIKIEVIDTDAKRSKNIANEISNVFIKEVPKLYNITNVSVLDVAEEAASAYNVNYKKQAVIYIGLGLMLGCMTVFLMYYFDRTIKTREQIETKIGLPVLGEVQAYDEKGGKA